MDTKGKCSLCKKTKKCQWATMLSPPILEGKSRTGRWEFKICPQCYWVITGRNQKKREVEDDSTR